MALSEHQKKLSAMIAENEHLQWQIASLRTELATTISKNTVLNQQLAYEGAELTAHIAETKAELAVTLDALEDVIQQACYSPRQGGVYDSLALSAYADAIRLLAKHGRLVIIADSNRRAIAVRPTKESDNVS